MVNTYREGLTTAAELGIQEPRACIIPADSSSPTDKIKRFPYVDFDRKNQYDLPCNEVVTALGLAISGLTVVERVPLRGCLAQRAAGLCPRNLGLTANERLEANP